VTALRFRHLHALAGFLAVAAFGAVARADPAEPAAPATSSPARPIEVPGWAFGSSTGEWILAGSSLVVAVVPPLTLSQRTTSWGPDATHSDSRNASNYSFVTVGASLGVALTSYVAQSERLEGAGVAEAWGRATPVLLSDAEAALFTFGLTEVIKREAGRCRPRDWQGTTCSDTDPDDNPHAAFPSSHTSLASAFAGVHLYEALAYGGTGNWITFAGLESLAVATGTLRVAAGAHSWSDVGAGFVLGHGAGLLIAFAHRPMTVTGRCDTMACALMHPVVGVDGQRVTLTTVF
jgi:membrane-associated phospholipid phosphatase